MYKDYSYPIFQEALKKLGITEEVNINFEVPKNKDHGDLSTNIAMQLARVLKKAPRMIAEDLIANLEYDKDIIVDVNIAGAGFINVKFSDKFFSIQLEKLIQRGKDLGRLNTGKGKKVIVEYVSANPTGMLHLGHGRNAVIGDTVANLYDWTGHEVTREYYFNNAGNQMNNLAKSIHARYMQEIEGKDFPFPEDGYQGEYIITIAKEFLAKNGNDLQEDSYQNMTEFRKYGENWCFEKIRATLKSMDIVQDNFFNEESLYKDGKIKEVIDFFKEKGLAYEKDGALWLKLSEMGLEDDRVIVKSTGEPTYRLPDMAYHREKYRRGFDISVDVFGSDHIATIPDVLAGIKALGYDPEATKILLHQFVTLTEDGKQVKMSKRTGKSYTLDDLLKEVGADVVRFFLLMRSISTHLEFDLSLAREQSDKNPVFYLQYAHARIASILAKLAENEIAIPSTADYALLTHKNEINLIKKLMKYENMIQLAADKMEPHVLADYLRELAAAFHLFYHDCSILRAETSEIRDARIKLSQTALYAMKNGLTILGVSAPEKM